MKSIATLVPLAHGGDLVVDLLVFAGPILALVGWLLWSRLRGGGSG